MAIAESEIAVLKNILEVYKSLLEKDPDPIRKEHLERNIRSIESQLEQHSSARK